MIKKVDFLERTIYLIREVLEKYLPKEGTLDEMVEIRNKLIKKILK
jgi:hypothetical protein